MLVISIAFIVPLLKYLCIHFKFNNIWKILYTSVQFLRLADTMGARITLVLFSSIWHAQSYHTAPIIKYFINIQLCTFFIKYFLNVWYHDKLYAITFLTWPPLISYACMAYGCAWCIYLYALLWFLSPKNNTTHKAKIPWSYFQQINSLFRIKKIYPKKKILCILQILNLNLIVCLSSSINLGTSCNMYVMSRVYDICLINGSVSSYP